MGRIAQIGQKMTQTARRYEIERRQLELTLDLIRFEARTRTIRECTGLSDDRIRKIYARYFDSTGPQAIKRRRGKSPCRVAHFTCNARAQHEATTLFYVFCAMGLLRISATGHAVARWPEPGLELGRRLCQSYQLYCAIFKNPRYNFEWSWALLRSVSQGEFMALGRCKECQIHYVLDRYAINLRHCPGCEIRSNRQRRPGIQHFQTSP